jgi:glycosyltransferase 2 family protein
MSSMADPSKTELNSKPRWRAYVVPGVLLVFVLVGVLLLGRGTDWREVGRGLAALSLWQIAVLLGLSLANYLARALRWHLMTSALQTGLSFRRSATHFLGGLAMAVTPGRLGELVRIRWISRETGMAMDRIAPVALTDRSSDLAAMALLLALSVAATGGSNAVGLIFALLVAAAGLSVALILMRPELLRLIAALIWRLTGKGARLMARLRRASHTLKLFARPQMVLATTLIGMAGWAAEGYAFHLLLVWLGHDIGLAKAVAIFTFATLAGGATGAPGGIGGAEAAMLGLLALEGVPFEAALPATIIIRVTTLWFAVLVGLIIFPFAERVRT